MDAMQAFHDGADAAYRQRLGQLRSQYRALVGEGKDADVKWRAQFPAGEAIALDLPDRLPVVCSAADVCSVSAIFQTSPDAGTYMLHVYTSSIYRLWRQRSRAVVSVHPDLVSEIRGATPASIPGEVLKQLPYISPMVVFPEPVVVETADHKQAEIIGLFVSGGSRRALEEVQFAEWSESSSTVFCDTSDPEMRSLSLTFVACVPEDTYLDPETGKTMTSGAYEVSRVTFDITGTVSVESVTDEIVSRYRIDYRLPDASVERRKKWVGDIVSFGLGVVLYLASADADRERVPNLVWKKHRAAQPGGGARLPKSVEMVRAGWVIGPAIRAARKRWQQSAGEKKPGRTQGPQHRRSHWKVVRKGPGRAVAELKFVGPYWTHREMLGESAPVVFHGAQ